MVQSSAYSFISPMRVLFSNPRGCIVLSFRKIESTPKKPRKTIDISFSSCCYKKTAFASGGGVRIAIV